MADITSFQSGNVGDKEGKVNWRGDQVLIPQGGQSINESSSVPLAELGSRKVVGDRVFRYARLGGVASAPGDVLQHNMQMQLSITAGSADPAGAKTFTFFKTASDAAADLFAEGNLWSQSGTAANLGQVYRVRTHGSISSNTNGTLYLYDALQKTVNVTDKWSIAQNPYGTLTQNTAGTTPTAGVLVCPATTNDYVWVQTWGPCAVKSLTAIGANASPVFATATGSVVGYAGTDMQNKQTLGYLMMTSTTLSERELVFLTIAP